MYKREYSHQAFPTEALCQGAKYTKDGMTLLDYFAAKAMQGIMGATTDCCSQDLSGNARAGSCLEVVARIAYETAAAMMEERKKYLNK